MVNSVGKMTLKRLEGGRFELSGGPLLFKHSRAIEEMAVKLLNFPFYMNGKPLKLAESIIIDDEAL